MATKQLSVHIPEPCHENWNAMTPREQGRFCSVCTKTVIDFSTMSDGQIIDLIKDSSKGNMCGHFHTDQLSRPLVAPAKPKWWMAPVWQYIVAALLFLKGMPAKAQGGVVIKEQCTPNYDDRKVGKIAARPITAKPVLVKGTVVNANGSPVAGAQVTVTGTSVTTTTNGKGAFVIRISQGQALSISAAGYEDTELGFNGKQNTVRAVLQTDGRVRGEMVMIAGGIRVQEEPYEVPAPVVYTVDYTLQDAVSGQAVTNASITWKHNVTHAVTNAQSNAKGFFAIKNIQPADVYQLRITAPGYLPKLWVVKGSDLKAVTNKQIISLEPAAAVEPLRVTMGIVAYPVDIPKNPVTTTEEKSITLQELALQIQEAVCNMPVEMSQPVLEKQPVMAEPQAMVAIKLQPNPVKAGEMATLRFEAKTAETVLVQLTTADGRILHHQKYTAITGTNTIALHTAAAWKGVVFVKLMNSRGKWIGTEQMVIE